MLRWTKRILSWVLQHISPHLHVCVVSTYQPAQAFFFLRKHPKIVNTGPSIVLVAGEDCPDKLGPYTSLYDVYEVLRSHFDVDLRVYRTFRARHAARIVEERPDLVVAASECADWHELYERHGIPVFGSPSAVCKLLFDKAAAKGEVQKLGVSTTPWVVVRRGLSIADITDRFPFPLVVKPRRASRSRGLSLVSSDRELRKAISKALEWDTEAIVEEFAQGKEFTCTVYGNDPPATLPLNRKIMDFERREIEASGGTVGKSRFPVLSDEPFVSRIHEQSKMIYSALQCRDMIRIDWKWDGPTQALRMLEINSMPWLGRTGGNIEECAIAAGSSYEDFLVDLIWASLRRQRRSVNCPVDAHRLENPHPATRRP